MNTIQFIRLTRPRTLAASLGPVILGTAFGASQFPLAQNIALSFLYTLAILTCVMCAQIAANIWNEYFDYKSGLDLKQAAGNSGSIVRDGLSPALIKKLGLYVSIIPLIIGFFLSAAITWWYLPIGAFCILISIIYSAGPYPLSRTPFGELASGLAMGFAIVCITIYAWAGILTATYLIPAIPSMLLVGAIMTTNNLRDYANDLAHGRHTLVILLGESKGLCFLGGLFIFSCLWLSAFIALAHLSLWTLLAWISLLPAYKSIHILNQYADSLMMNQAMKFTSIATMLYHILFAIGLLLGL